MKRVFKWIGIAIAVALGGVVVFVIGMMLWVNSRLDRTYHIEPRAVAVLTDSASVAEGKRLFSIYCSECHGDNAAGTAFFHNPSLGSVNAPNLTRGRGGVATLYHNTSDWVRAIRHGITPKGSRRSSCHRKTSIISAMPTSVIWLHFFALHLRPMVWGESESSQRWQRFSLVWVPSVISQPK